jgi:hypothetical protein
LTTGDDVTNSNGTLGWVVVFSLLVVFPATLPQQVYIEHLLLREMGKAQFFVGDGKAEFFVGDEEG